MRIRVSRAKRSKSAMNRVKVSQKLLPDSKLQRSNSQRQFLGVKKKS